MGAASAIIGREKELDAVCDRLAGRRLVTLTGPGGMGKTALARRAAERLSSRYALGHHVVDLTRVVDAAGVESSLAVQLGFPSFAALVDSPSDQPALLVIDGCEHVLDAAASVLERLLDACEAPTILATSRSPLGIAAESVVMLGPLSVPPADSTEVDSDAARLFLARARDAGALISERDHAGVAALCRALDGVPLALEIAAARTRVLAPAEILGHLDDLDLLSRPRHRGTERHRSLRSTIEWSYRQLDEVEQRFFDRLAVLAGWFDIDDARAVTSGRESRIETIDTLDALVGASLLGTETAPEGTRYRQLQTVRTFARERLVASSGWDDTWERFLDHVVEWPRALVARAGNRWDRTIVDGMLVRLEAHLSALRWTVVHDDDPTRSLILVATLWGVVHQGHAEEIGELAETTLARWPEAERPGWADAAATAATCRYLVGRPDEAITLAQRALDHAPEGTFAQATLRRVTAQSLAAVGDVEAAVAVLDDAIELSRDSFPPMAWEMVAMRAELGACLGEVDVGLDAVRLVKDEATAAGAEINAIWAASVEASLLLRLDNDAAAMTAHDALDRSRAVRYPACESVNLHTLAEAAIVAGNLEEAAERLVELIDLLVAGGARTELRNALRAAATVLRHRGDPVWADLAATAEALPSVSVFVIPGHERLPPPAPTGRVLDQREAVTTCRMALAGVALPSDIRDDGAAPGASVDTAGVGGRRSGRFVMRGEAWELTWTGRPVTVHGSKGMDDLARLLGQPGREIHSLELMDAAVEQTSTGDVIDGQARREYENRIRDLHEDVEIAEADNDFVRAERAQAELDAIVDHLAAALSITGRSRTTASSAERARSAVTQRIRSTIRRISGTHPELGRHLSVSVRTGTYCSYQPEDPVDWDLKEGPDITM